MGYNARNDEIHDNIVRMQRAWEAERDALATVRRFNARLSAKGSAWFWPKIAAAITSKHHWLVIACDSCGAMVDLDLSMSEDPRSQSEIDGSGALDAVEVATFEADELLNRVLIRTRLPTDRRIDAFQDAGALLHHTYHAMRFVRRAFERRHEWPDPSDQALQMTDLAQLADALEDMEEAKSHLGLAFFIFEVAANPSHWSNIIEPKKYAAVFERVSTALEKVKLAIDSLTSLQHSPPPDQNT